MPDHQSLPTVFIGHDSREAIASDVLSHSIRRRTNLPTEIKFLKHRELRKSGHFARPWLTEGDTGNWKDLIDNKPFSTEFSHTRFLVPALMEFKGWALFVDSDMVFLSDIKKLFALFDDKYALMCVKHQHRPQPNEIKMDGRQQTIYQRKNWSSFMAINCAHPSNAFLTKEKVNFMTGADLHALSWLKDYEIGDLPNTYNYISGVSPKLPPERGGMPDVVHYTAGGPWFAECKDVPFSQVWIDEFESWSATGHDIISPVASTVHEK